MKYIKKVSVTPVASNTGTIINSFSTSDDKTLNAPSIAAVEGYVGGEETVSYTNLKVKGYANGAIGSTSATGRITFRKRHGMVFADITSGSVYTESFLLFFNNDDTPFKIPDKFVPVSSSNQNIPEKITCFTNAQTNNKEIAAIHFQNKLTSNDVLVHDGLTAYVESLNGTGGTWNTNLYFRHKTYYMADTI